MNPRVGKSSTMNKKNSKNIKNAQKNKTNSKSNLKKTHKYKTTTKSKKKNKKKKKSNLKIFIYIIIFMILLVVSAFFTYYYNLHKNYDRLVIEGNQHFNVEEYDEAKESYKKALDYKSDNHIYNKIEKVNKIVESKSYYSTGLNLKKQVKYKEAINNFKKVSISDKARYYHAQNEIQECTRLINGR